MSKPPLDATALRNTHRLLKRELDLHKMRVAVAEQELTKWKERFDALLMRTPQISSDPTTTEKNT